MAPLLECVMNVSEGRDPALLAAIQSAIAGCEGAWLLDVSADSDHHRSVWTFVGDAGGVHRAALAAARRAIAAIDLTRHRGVHPRVGAVDVVPFVPIEAGLADCVAAAHRFGRALWERNKVPVYYYGEAASRPEWRDLARLRPELIRTAASEKRPAPDVGQGNHPTAGVTLVAARFPLIAFNVYLATDDLEIARRIASRVRERGGGLPSVRALGFAIPSRGLVQVSMNLLHYPTTSIAHAWRRVVREAEAEGVATAGSELIGLAPAAALDEATAREVRLADFGPDRILEERIRQIVP